MNIENLKNMPVVGQPGSGSGAIEAIATAIHAAGQEAKDFIETEVTEMEATAAKAHSERAATHQQNAEEIQQAITDGENKYDDLFGEYDRDVTQLIADITANNEPEAFDSISEALEALEKADGALETSLLNFDILQSTQQTALEREYGSAAEVALILGSFAGEQKAIPAGSSAIARTIAE